MTETLYFCERCSQPLAESEFQFCTTCQSYLRTSYICELCEADVTDEYEQAFNDDVENNRQDSEEAMAIAQFFLTEEEGKGVIMRVCAACKKRVQAGEIVIDDEL